MEMPLSVHQMKELRGWNGQVLRARLSSHHRLHPRRRAKSQPKLLSPSPLTCLGRRRRGLGRHHYHPLLPEYEKHVQQSLYVSDLARRILKSQRSPRDRALLPTRPLTRHTPLLIKSATDHPPDQRHPQAMPQPHHLPSSRHSQKASTTQGHQLQSLQIS